MSRGETRPLRVLIADDEELARRRLARLVRGVEGAELVAQCADSASVVERVKQGDIDVALLDIRMPGLSAVEALALLPPSGPGGAPYVIFCTAHADHAVSAFDVGAVDFLLKPIDGVRLARALGRARARHALDRFQEAAKHQGAPMEGSASPPDRLAVPTRDSVVLLDYREVSHAAIEGELVTIYSARGTYFTDLSLQALLERLPAGVFVRVHRKAIVNWEHVEHLEPCSTGGYVARTRQGYLVKVARQAARALRRRLGLRRGGS
jgi:two-component system LytT family response regulator